MSLRVADGTWRVRPVFSLARAVEIDGDLNGRFETGTLSSSTLAGALLASAGDMRSLARLLNDLGWPPPAALRASSGRARLAMNVNGTIGAPSAAGHLTLDQLRFADMGAIEARSDLAVDQTLVAG